jgi:hypothetical protein
MVNLSLESVTVSLIVLDVGDVLMTRCAIRFISFSTLLLSCASLQAALILYEPFDDSTPNRVLGQANASTGTSWLLAAASTASGDTTAINSATVNGIGNLSGAADRLAFASTGGAITAGSVFFSMAMKVTDINAAQSNNTIGGFFFGLNNTGNSATTTNPSSVAGRLQMRIDPTDASKYDIALFNNRGAVSTNTFWTNGLTVGDTLFLVGSYDIANQISKLWVNPDPSTFDNNSLTPAPTLTDTTAGSAINIASIILRQSPAPFATVDEIRVGTDWASVTVPEPASLLLGAMGGVAMICGARRRCEVDRLLQ